MSTSTRQPDILEVIADLSNDEVFTPPKVASQVLDLLPTDVWTNPDLTFLDPGTKTGVFLRAITKRLMAGLADVIPDETQRLRHILTNQVYGIAITELTALMSRRTLYCSKDASGERSTVRMPTSSGNLWHEPLEHEYANGKCVECGAAEKRLSAGKSDETYAYAFIHEAGLRAFTKELDMRFDVIVGNPPYQMGTSTETSQARPIYNAFVEGAIAMNPRHIAMVIPSRWMTGGMGLDGFRSRMLKGKQLAQVVDFQNAQTVFPGINLNGGVCYFHWERDYAGECQFTHIPKSGEGLTATRPLDQFDIVVRPNGALPILGKVLKSIGGNPRFDVLVSPINPFGMPTNFKGSERKPSGSAVKVVRLGGETWVRRKEISQRADWIDKFKVLIPKATDGNEVYPLPVLTEPIVAGPGTACTMTYLVIGPWDTEGEAQNACTYLKTRFFRYLLSLRKHTQDNSREKFSFIPLLDLDRAWTDEDLYKKYKITKDEQAYIAEMIKEMPAS
ncbi:MAG: Eco57I restriction-modification methylase domain-containing protein [Actinobacteria bacterium]|nr:Eco57I restriction-modification methylase domain-containing protein [Actinomycetota bacterium]TXH43060.1 MAG: restriction endonuclease [Actinomycetota bacterium]